jgi:hypothetical protein
MTASVALPATLRPAGVGNIHRMKKNASHAVTKPQAHLPGERPDSRMWPPQLARKDLPTACVCSLMDAS